MVHFVSTGDCRHLFDLSLSPSFNKEENKRIFENFSWDRNTARAAKCEKKITITHVSASPPFHPGQSDFPSPVGDLDHSVIFPKGPS